MTDFTPRIGELGFTETLDAAFGAGLVTAEERRRLRLEHFTAVRLAAEASPDEAGFLAALAELLATPDPAICRYPDHRPTDWLADGNRLVCGECHPPAVQTARYSPLGVGFSVDVDRHPEQRP